MRKKLLSVLLAAVLLLSVGIPWAAAEESTDSVEVLVLTKENCDQEIPSGNLIVLVEGEVTLYNPLDCKNLLLVVLPGSNLTINTSGDSCVKAETALLLTERLMAL